MQVLPWLSCRREKEGGSLRMSTELVKAWGASPPCKANPRAEAVQLGQLNI